MLAYGMKSGEGKYLIGGDGDGVVEDVTDLGEGVVSLLLDLVDSELVLLNLSGELLDLGSEVVAGLLGLLLLADLDSGDDGERRTSVESFLFSASMLSLFLRMTLNS